MRHGPWSWSRRSNSAIYEKTLLDGSHQGILGFRKGLELSGEIAGGMV